MENEGIKVIGDGIWISREELESMAVRFLELFDEFEESLPKNCYEASGKAWLCRDLIKIIDQQKNMDRIEGEYLKHHDKNGS